MDEKALQNKIQAKVRARLSPLFARYRMDFDDLEALLKWRPVVLVLGNYSSGKSTFINELLGREVQRTGQAPTDDSFTIITAPEPGAGEAELPGADLVNDSRLPFGVFKDFGEQFIAHFRMKKVAVPLFENLAVIDSPGMLDSVSERDRGYDYAAVIREFARLADLVVLMFDPHKAGTIQETYTTIRNILPEAVGEDRLLFVLSRVDECDNLADLLRSYGTLCWNLSQMTGRKDIPRIFLTFSPQVGEVPPELAVWGGERELLKQEILAAAGLRINHILQNVDKQLQELRLVAEAMASYAVGGRRLVADAVKWALVLGLLGFLFVDMGIKARWGVPDRTLLPSLIEGLGVGPMQLLIPVSDFVALAGLVAVWLSRVSLPRHLRRCREGIDGLVVLDTDYRRHVWERVRGRVGELLAAPSLGGLFVGHQANVRKIDRFLGGVMQEYYRQIGK